MPLFELPEKPKKNSSKNELNIKIKKGQTIDDLVLEAKKLVEEKLKNYKNASKCITDPNELIKFFEETDDLLALDTETTGLNTYTDTFVGASFSNGKENIYVPINHKSILYNTRLNSQMQPEDFRKIIKEYLYNPRFKLIFHNAKFDLSVYRTFLGQPLPDPYWDTMLRSKFIKPR